MQKTVLVHGSPWLTPANKARVKQAVEKGVTVLKASLDGKGPALDLFGHGLWALGDWLGIPAEGAWLGREDGVEALAGLALLASGVPGDDPVLSRAAEFVRWQAVRQPNTSMLTYCILFLDRLGKPEDRRLIRSLGLRIVAGQRPQGGWDYDCPVLSRAEEDELLELLRSPRLTLPANLPPFTPPSKPVPQPQAPNEGDGVRTMDALRWPKATDLPVWRFQPGMALPATIGYLPDESNPRTLRALLALWAAQRHGLPVRRSLAFAEAHLRSTQCPDGHWGFSPTREHAGASAEITNSQTQCFGDEAGGDVSTCAGLIGLALGHGLRIEGSEGGWAEPLRGVPPRQLSEDRAATRALCYLATKLGRPGRAARPKAPQEEEKLAAITKASEQMQAAQGRQRLGAYYRWNTRLNEYRNLLSQRGDTIFADKADANLHFLLAVERVAAVYDLDAIDGKDWYGWGAELLVSHQQPDGHWYGGNPGLVDTSRALLFLTRSNLLIDLTQRLRTVHLTGPGLGTSVIEVPADGCPVAIPTSGGKEDLSGGATSPPSRSPGQTKYPPSSRDSSRAGPRGRR